MSLAAATVIASMPLLGGVHLDADTQGRNPVLATLNADGGGAVAAVSGSEHRPRAYARVLRSDGTWGARIKVQHEPAGLAPAGAGRFTLATARRSRYGGYRVLRVRVITPAA